MELSVVIPSFNRARLLLQLLESLSQMEIPAKVTWEILLIDNNSTDHTKDVVQNSVDKFSLDIHYHFQPIQGASQARNLGIERAKGDIIAFLDDDEIVDPHWIKAVLNGFKDSSCAAVGGRITAKWVTGVPSWYTLHGKHRIVGPTAEHDIGDIKREYDFRKDCLPATGNFAARRYVFHKYGNFRTDMGPVGKNYFIGEDTEFCIRLIKNGEKIVYLPEARVYNTVHESRLSKAYCRKYHFRFGRSLAQLSKNSATIYKWGPVPRYLFREAVEALIRWCLSSLVAGKKLSFFYELRFDGVMGQIYEWIVQSHKKCLVADLQYSFNKCEQKEKNYLLFLHNGDKLIRGSERCLLMFLERLDRNQFHPVAICNASRLKLEIEKLGIEVKQIEFPEIMIDGQYRKLNFLKYIKTLKAVAEFVKDHRIDLIYSNSGLPCQIGLPVSRLFRIPILVHLHAPHTKRYAWLWLLKFADKIIFVSRFISEHLINKVKLQGSSTVVYNGVDCHNTFYPARSRDSRIRYELGLDDSEIVIGQVGSLIRRKGLDILINAFALLKRKYCKENIKLVIVGEGELREDLENLVESLQLRDSVIFTGETRDPERFYRHVFDINVLASRSEAFPLSLLEAAACGLANVCTDCEGMKEGIIIGKTGLTFEKENAAELAEKLAALIENSELRKEMGILGREMILQNLSVDKYAENIQKEIMQLLNSYSAREL